MHARACVCVCVCVTSAHVFHIKKNIDCTLLLILCNFLFAALFYCTNKAAMCNKISNIIPKYLILNHLHKFSSIAFCKVLIIKQLKIIFVFSQKKLLKYFVVSYIVHTFATSNNKNNNQVARHKVIVVTLLGGFQLSDIQCSIINRKLNAKVATIYLKVARYTLLHLYK